MKKPISITVVLMLLFSLLLSCSAPTPSDSSSGTETPISSPSDTSSSLPIISSKLPESPDALSAEFSLGGDPSQKQLLRAGDSIGEWTLEDLEIEISESDGSVQYMESLFTGNLSLKGMIMPSGLEENLFAFQVSKEDLSKIPIYFADDESPPKDDFWIILDFADDSMIPVGLEEEKECTIKVDEYTCIFAYMMAPNSFQVTNLEFLD